MGLNSFGRRKIERCMDFPKQTKNRLFLIFENHTQKVEGQLLALTQWKFGKKFGRRCKSLQCNGVCLCVFCVWCLEKVQGLLALSGTPFCVVVV